MPAVAQGREEEEVVRAQCAHVGIGGSERCRKVGQNGGNSGAGGQSVANILAGVVGNGAQDLCNHHVGGK